MRRSVAIALLLVLGTGLCGRSVEADEPLVVTFFRGADGKFQIAVLPEYRDPNAPATSLAEVLAKHARLGEKTFSDSVVRIEADPETPWWMIRIVPQLCTRDSVRIYRIEMVNPDGARTIPIELPFDVGIRSREMERDRNETLEIAIAHDATTGKSAYRLDDVDLGGPSGLRDAVERNLQGSPRSSVTLAPWIDTPYRVLVAGVEAAYDGGARSIWFTRDVGEFVPKLEREEKEDWEENEEDWEEVERPEDDHGVENDENWEEETQRDPRSPKASPTRAAIDAGLEWLARHQDTQRGCWDADDFDSDCQGECSGHGAHWGDVGLTGISLLAFLGDGNTYRMGDGAYQETVKRALKYLRDEQGDDGLIGERTGHYIYNHAIAALAVTEAYALTRSPMLKDLARKSIEFLESSQTPGAGWRYTSRAGESDTSVTAWAMMALKTAQIAELPLDPRSTEGVRRWLDSVTDTQTGRTGYRRPGDRGSQPPQAGATFERFETATAISIMSRIFMGSDRSDPLLQRQAEIVLASPPRWSTDGGPGGTSLINPYYWYFGTLSSFQIGGDAWKGWHGAIKEALVPHQESEGHATGSWPSLGPWRGGGGRIYATSLALLSLEIVARYESIFD